MSINPKALEVVHPIAVSFTEKGSLGLKLTPNKATGDIEILGINPGTQAERHPQLATGLVLKTVGGASVAGKKYEEVLGMIKAGGRPLAMVFVDKVDGVTGAAAAKALQEHIMKKGTGDVKKIDRLRRASLQPDLPGSAQKAQDEAAAMMAAAMSSVDEEAGDAPASAPGTPNQTASLSQRIEDLEAAKDAAAKARNFREAGRIKEQLQPLRRTMVEALYAKHNPEKLPQVDGLVAKYGEEKLYKMVRKKYSELHAQPAAAAGGDGTPAAVAAAGAVTTVIFTEPGALGLKFTPNKLTGGVEVLQVNPGTQAERHTQLHPGLVLQTIGEVSAAGKPYDQVIATIKAGGRPLSMTFSSDTSAPAAALDSIAVSFTEKGSLGLKLTPNKATGDIEILGINPGTQAERHPQLATGLVLKTVGGASVAGKKYEEVLGMIKAGGRPLAMVFVGKANEAPLGEPKVESSNDEAAVAPEQVEEGVPPMEASAVFRGAISGESNIELEPEKAPEPEKEPEPEQEPEQEPESEPVQQPQGPSQAAIEAIPRREPRPKFFNAGGATRNPYRAPLEEMKQKQLQQLQKFQQYAAAGDWQDIHAGHFDWFMFPIEDGSQHSYNVLAEDVVELLADDEWRERYYSSVQLVAAAWAWDIASSQPISPPLAGQGWTDWDVRLSKMIRSLWLFGCRAEMRSLQAFALTVKPHGGLRYGHINLDEVYFMTLEEAPASDPEPEQPSKGEETVEVDDEFAAMQAIVESSAVAAPGGADATSQAQRDLGALLAGGSTEEEAVDSPAAVLAPVSGNSAGDTLDGMPAAETEEDPELAQALAEMEADSGNETDRIRRPSMLQGIFGVGAQTQEEPTSYASSLLALADEDEEDEEEENENKDDMELEAFAAELAPDETSFDMDAMAAELAAGSEPDGGERSPDLEGMMEELNAGDEIVVTFTQPGPLGLNLTPCRIASDGVMILAVQQNTQAAEHYFLQRGLVIKAVNDTSVAGMSHVEVTDLIGGCSERPLTVKFFPGSEAATPSSQDNGGDRSPDLEGMMAELDAGDIEEPKPQAQPEKPDRTRRPSMLQGIFGAGAQTSDEPTSYASSLLALADEEEEEEEEEEEPEPEPEPEQQPEPVPEKIDRIRRPSMLQGIFGASAQTQDEPTSYASSLLALADEEEEEEEEEEEGALPVPKTTLGQLAQTRAQKQDELAASRRLKQQADTEYLSLKEVDAEATQVIEAAINSALESAAAAPVMTYEPVSYTVGFGDYELDYRPTMTREQRIGGSVEAVATKVTAKEEPPQEQQQQQQGQQQPQTPKRMRRPSMLQGIFGASAQSAEEEPTSYASSLLALADEDEEDEQAEAEEPEPVSDEIVVTFTQPGPLGLNLTPCRIASDGVMILAVQQNTQAAEHYFLQRGLVIKAVNDTSVAGMSHVEVTDLIGGCSERPLTVKFFPGSEAATPSSQDAAAAVVAGGTASEDKKPSGILLELDNEDEAEARAAEEAAAEAQAWSVRVEAKLAETAEKAKEDTTVAALREEMREQVDRLRGERNDLQQSLDEGTRKNAELQASHTAMQQRLEAAEALARELQEEAETVNVAVKETVGDTSEQLQRLEVENAALRAQIEAADGDSPLAQKLHARMAAQKASLIAKHDEAMRAKDKAWTVRLLRMQEQHHADQLASYRRQLEIAAAAHKAQQEQLRQRQAEAATASG